MMNTRTDLAWRNFKNALMNDAEISPRDYALIEAFVNLSLKAPEGMSKELEPHICPRCGSTMISIFNEWDWRQWYECQKCGFPDEEPDENLTDEPMVKT